MGGQNQLKFIISLDRVPITDAKVPYHSIDQTAKSGVDYTAISGDLNFIPGQTTQTLLIPVLESQSTRTSRWSWIWTLR